MKPWENFIEGDFQKCKSGSRNSLLVSESISLLVQKRGVSQVV